MSKSRASIFAEPPELDVSSFAPKTAIDNNAPAPAEVRTVSEAAQFRSREASAPKPREQSKRAARRYRTGRDTQFNVKADRKTVEAFYGIADAQKWILGYTLERAVEALKRELSANA